MEATKLTIEEVSERMERDESLIFLDVRSAEAWDKSQFKIPGAIHVPLDEVDQRLTGVSRGRTIITYCT